MVDPQLPIKIALVAAVALVALVIVWPGRGARRMAMRRLGTVALVVVAALAIALPDVTTSIANFVGVGRGADLLLYCFVVAFVAFVFASRVERRRVDAQITRLARGQALASASRPWEAAE